MDKFPSIEKLAAFFEGNLLEKEMQQITRLAADNEAVHDILDANTVIGDTMASFDEQDMQPPNEIAGMDFELPEIDNNKVVSLDIDRFWKNCNLYSQEGYDADEFNNQESEQLIYSKEMETYYRTYGESGENLYDPVYIRQPDDHSCALRSQQIVLRDFGIDIPFKDLEKLAKDYGVYTDQGTYTYDIGKVLQIAGVDMHQVYGTSMYDLTNELAQGHRVIVSLDARELWYNDSFSEKLKNWFDDTFKEQGGNHALIVAGVEVNPNNPEDVQVVLTDPGAGHLRIEYPLEQFMNAWKDSNCFMAATNNPAPYQYDAETGKELPSNFVVNQYINDFVATHGYQLNPDLINIPQDYQAQLSDHLTMVGNMSYSDFEEDFNDYQERIIPSELSIKEQIEKLAKESLQSDETAENGDSEGGKPSIYYKSDGQDTMSQENEDGDDAHDEDENEIEDEDEAETEEDNDDDDGNEIE
ncbi:MAG: hypothetical protein IKH33_01425 [Bacteroidales bacterium]|nr:hypothetical protein [Bacteroidales bacterium]